MRAQRFAMLCLAFAVSCVVNALRPVARILNFLPALKKKAMSQTLLRSLTTYWGSTSTSSSSSLSSSSSTSSSSSASSSAKSPPLLPRVPSLPNVLAWLFAPEDELAQGARHLVETINATKPRARTAPPNQQQHQQHHQQGQQQGQQQGRSGPGYPQSHAHAAVAAGKEEEGAGAAMDAALRVRKLTVGYMEYDPLAAAQKHLYRSTKTPGLWSRM